MKDPFETVRHMTIDDLMAYGDLEIRRKARQLACDLLGVMKGDREVALPVFPVTKGNTQDNQIYS